MSFPWNSDVRVTRSTNKEHLAAGIDSQFAGTDALKGMANAWQRSCEGLNLRGRTYNLTPLMQSPHHYANKEESPSKFRGSPHSGPFCLTMRSWGADGQAGESSAALF